jgi:predicted permease
MIDRFVFAARQLSKSPGFALIAVLTLGLGLGFSATIFSLINELFLKGLPFPEPNRIVRIYGEAKDRNLILLPTSVPRFWHFRDGQTAFTDLAADFSGINSTLTGPGEPAQVNIAAVTSNYLNVLDLRPILGRAFLPQEESSADVAIVSEGFWRKRLNSDPAVLGRSITLNGVAHTVIGVIHDPPVAWFGANLEVLITKPFEGKNVGLTPEQLAKGAGFLRIIGRLKPRVSIDQARAAVSALQNSYHDKYPENHDGLWTNTLVTAPEDAVGSLRPAFVTLVIAVGFVVIIACTNVANLLLVRFTSRRREIALRMALGGSRSNVISLFVAESTLVSLLGGAVGAAMAWQLIPLVPKLAGANVPIDPSTSAHIPVLLFALLLSLLTGVAIGFYPAWQSSRTDLSGTLKESGRSTIGSPRQQRSRKILIGAQVALSITLLAGASLMIASFVRLRNQDIGFQPNHLWVGSLNLPAASYADDDRRTQFVQHFLDEIKKFPELQSVSIGESVPLAGFARSYYARTDQSSVPIGQRPVAPLHYVSPGFFKTLGIPLVEGRDFDEQDAPNHPPVAIISRALAQKLFGDKNAVGQQILMGNKNQVGEPLDIVAVVGDVRSLRVDTANDAEIYRPWPQRNTPLLRIAVRSGIRQDEIMRIVRLTLNNIDPSLAILQPGPMSLLVDTSLGQARLMMVLLGAFAGAALLLATVGIYGAVAYSVEQRRGEIGVRMALGAQTMDVLRLITNQGMKPVVIGLIAGLVTAIALGRLLTAQLYQVSPYNPLLLAAVALLLAAAALLACIVPARKASLVDPVFALRSE